MTLDDLKQLPVFQTKTIAEACKDPATRDYILDCLVNKFWAGDYGTICEEDTEANNEDLKNGDGHALAKYPAKGALQGAFYIEAHFYDKPEYKSDIDYNNIMICYPSER